MHLKTFGALSIRATDTDFPNLYYLGQCFHVDLNNNDNDNYDDDDNVGPETPTNVQQVEDLVT